jgi:signal transduction histidine kinase
VTVALRPILLVAAVAVAGALGTLAVAAAIGMRTPDLLHLAAFLTPAALVTVLAMAIARPLLARASLRGRLAAVAVVGAVVSMANVFALSMAMFVSGHDAALIGVVLLYAIGAGVGCSLVVARSISASIERVAGAARNLGRGDLDARVGRMDQGPELDALGRTLDEMADRLRVAMERERRIEGQHRDLMTAVSHDLRTPLASLRAMVEAIDDGVVEDLPSLRRYVAQMRRSVGQLAGMVDDLFELAQLDAGAIAQETERVRLGDLVRSAVDAAEPHAEAKGLRVQADLNGADDSLCSPRMARVLQDLLVNAIRYTPADGTVRIEARRGPRELEVAVEDSGEGIDPRDLERVFEPFFRADRARSGDGAGLGLALARRIVEALGGRIRVQSRPAVGSRFEVQLPL